MFKKLFIIFLILVPSSFVLTLVLLYSQNSLYSNGQWIVQKRMAQMGVNGADEYLLTRMPLAQNILNLGRYYGYQGVFLKNINQIQSFNVSFKIEKEGYLDIIYSSDKGQMRGVRISRRLDTPSLFFESNNDGKFLSQHHLNNIILNEDWHQMTFSQNSSGEVVFQLDKNSEAIVLQGHVKLNQIGFRSGLQDVLIRNVQIQTDQAEWQNYSFSHTKKWWSLFARHLLILFVFGLLFSLRSIRSFFTRETRFFYFWITFSLVITCCASIWFVFDFSYYSLKIPVKTGITQALFHQETSDSYSVEEVRYALFSRWFKILGGEGISQQGVVEQGYPNDRIWRGPIYCKGTSDCIFGDLTNHNIESKKTLKESYRIVFVGSSQTVGAGALSLQDSFFVRQHRRLVELLPKPISLESLNIAISGAQSPELLQEYKAIYSKFRPDLVIINLAHNDGDHELFFKTMSQFLTINQSLQIKTILVAEPYSPELSMAESVQQNYQKLKLLAESYHVPLYKADEYFASSEIRLSGQIWSDEVHLTSYGHAVMADWLVPKIFKVLRSVQSK